MSSYITYIYINLHHIRYLYIPTCYWYTINVSYVYHVIAYKYSCW